MTLELGIVGYSDGNGHPYSWSAIINGYDAAQMDLVGYPTIAAYLAEQEWPAARLRNASVTRVWTQDPARSKSIARASLVPVIASDYSDLIDNVDAVLLARDDAENHFRFAKPVLNAGKPIYIDKPIAHSVQEMNRLYALEKFPGQIFTCSALRYAEELQLSDEQRDGLGDILEIHAVTPRSWKKYGVHIIEPVVGILDPSDSPVEMSSSSFSAGHDSTGLSIRWSSGIISRFFAVGDVNTGIRIHVLGSKGECLLVFRDSFSAFKRALREFIEGISQGEVRSPRSLNQRVVELIEAGCDK